MSVHLIGAQTLIPSEPEIQVLYSTKKWVNDQPKEASNGLIN
jgi:hypothetical protein